MRAHELAWRCTAALAMSIFVFIRVRQHGASSIVETNAAGDGADDAFGALSLYGIAADWPSNLQLGSHRARLQLTGESTGMARARVEWRLPGLQMDGRQMVLMDEGSGSRLRNVHIVSSSWEAAEIVFEVDSNDHQPRRHYELRDLRQRTHAIAENEATYSYEEGQHATITGWKPRSEPGCQCTGYKNVHGFGAFCKAWEIRLEPLQTPWCYVSSRCDASDVHKGTFGERYLDCMPTYADDMKAPAGARQAEELALADDIGDGGDRHFTQNIENDASETNGDESTYSYSESENANIRGWMPRSEPGCQCNGYKNAHGFGSYCKAWEQPVQTPWCYVSATCTASDMRQGSFGERYLDCTPIYSQSDSTEPKGVKAPQARSEMARGGSADNKLEVPGTTSHATRTDTASIARATAARDGQAEPNTVPLVDLSQRSASTVRLAGPRLSRFPWWSGGRSLNEHDATNGDARMLHSVRTDRTRESRLRAEPVSTTFLLYYLPFDDSPCVTGPASSCTSHYMRARGSDFRGSRRFRQRVLSMTQQAAWRDKLPAAKVVAFEARTARDSFHPMEVAATSQETAAMHDKGTARPLLVWTEDRKHPIRMLDRLPLRWLSKGLAPVNASAHVGNALLGEFYTFQIGAYAPQSSITIKPSWTTLAGPGGSMMAPWRLRCINRPNGSAQAESGIHLPHRAVQPLWFGLDVPSDVHPGVYKGLIRLTAQTQPDFGKQGSDHHVESVALEVHVQNVLTKSHGDDELWRHSRLRWLDSTAGEDRAAGNAAHGVISDRADVWEPVRLHRETLSLIASGNRVVRLSRRGLPASLKVGSTELLTEATQVRLLGVDNSELRWVPTLLPEFNVTSTGSVTWRVHGIVPNSSKPPAGCRRLAVEVKGELYTDGLAQFSIALRAVSVQRGRHGIKEGCALSDVQLTMPLVEDATKLINGFGWKGATRPDEVRFKWDERAASFGQRGLNCRVWLGGADAGIQLNLQGIDQSKAASSSHCGQDENGELQCDDLTDAQYNVALGSSVWYNKNQGGATIVTTQMPPVATKGRVPRRKLATSRGVEGSVSYGRKVVLLTVFSGPVQIPFSEALVLPFRLLLTPVRGAGKPRSADFATRYFHMQRFTTVDQAVSAAPDAWIILHQGNQLNPYINYPFLTLAPLQAYVREAHAKGAKVKLYYTVRELSTSAVEFWALRSLNGEVIVPSRTAKGHAWLKEHVRSNYSASWHERLSDGEVDASVHTPAFTTRWDNYWIEGILWLVKNVDIDGIYLDGAPYERSILRRLRAALEPLTARRHSPFLLDLHASCAGNPHLPYVELYPYLDSIWFGEQCDYHSYSPNQWLAEVSGVPFGLQGEVLGDNRDQWHALVFGMTCRIYPDPYRCNPRPLWAALDGMGMHRPQMIGWWDEASPISISGAKGSAEHVHATMFISESSVAIAIANWSPVSVNFRLSLDWSRVPSVGRKAHVDPTYTRLVAPHIEGFQESGSWLVGETLRVHGKGSGKSEGWLLKLTTQ